MNKWFRKTFVGVLALSLIGGTATGASAAAGLQPDGGKQAVSLGHAGGKVAAFGSNEALYRLTTIAGSGEYNDWDGDASEAAFRMPQGVIVLDDGSVLVSDSRNHLIKKVSGGKASVYAGVRMGADDDGTPLSGWHDGDRGLAAFNAPSGMSADKDGNVFVADAENHLIRKLAADGEVSTVAGNGILGEADGEGDAASFYHPSDVAVASDGTLYVADTLNHLIRRISPGGKVSTLNAKSDRVVEAASGLAVPTGDYADGKLEDAKFNEPSGLAIDKLGNLYVSDTGNHLIRYIDLQASTVTTVAGMPQGGSPHYAVDGLYADGGYADGASAAARFHSPKGIAVTGENGLLIADSLNHSIRYLLDGQVATLAGTPAHYGNGDGINGYNQLHAPTDIAVLPNGDFIIADSYNQRIRQFQWYRLPEALPSNDEVKVVMEDQIVTFDAQPEITSSRTMVPVRALSELLGYDVEFEEDSEGMRISMTGDEVRIELQEGHTGMTVSEQGESKVLEMDAKPYIKHGRTYVPVRFFSQSFGLDVQWEPASRTVILREAGEAPQVWGGEYTVRTAAIEQVRGHVLVRKAGGAQELRAFDGMTLSHGDYIFASNGSSAVLVTDRKDEITVSENTELYLAMFKETKSAKHAGLMVWSGAVWADVVSLADSEDTYQVRTWAANTSVRGTHFMVNVDPVTGRPNLYVSAGRVQVEPLGGKSNGKDGTGKQPTQVLPAQQLELYPTDPGAASGLTSKPTFVDPEEWARNASPAVIEAMLRNKEQIDKENREMLEKSKKQLENGEPSSDPALGSMDDLERLQHNLDHILANLLQQAVQQGTVDEKQMKEIMDRTNQQTGSDREWIAGGVPVLQLTEQMKREQELARRAKERQRQQQEAKKQQQEQVKEQHQNLINQIIQNMEDLQEENKRQQEQKSQDAIDRYKSQLTEVQQTQFEQRRQEAEGQKKRQEEELRPPVLPPVRPVPNPNPNPNPEPEPNTAPVVAHALDDVWVNEGAEITLEIAQVFNDEDGDELTLSAVSDNDTAEVALEGTELRITPVQHGRTTITLSADDGNGGVSDTSFQLNYYPALMLEDHYTSPTTIDLYWGWAYEPGEDMEGLSYRVYSSHTEEMIETREGYARLSDLTPDTAYTIRIEAVGEGDELLAFSIAEILTDPLGMIEGMQTVWVADNSAMVAWNIYSGEYEQYIYKVYLNGEELAELEFPEAKETYTYILTELDSGQAYDIRIEAWDHDRMSKWAESSSEIMTVSSLPAMTGMEIRFNDAEAPTDDPRLYWNEVEGAERYAVYLNDDPHGYAAASNILHLSNVMEPEGDTAHFRIFAWGSNGTLIAFGEYVLTRDEVPPPGTS